MHKHLSGQTHLIQPTMMGRVGKPAVRPSMLESRTSSRQFPNARSISGSVQRLNSDLKMIERHKQVFAVTLTYFKLHPQPAGTAILYPIPNQTQSVKYHSPTCQCAYFRCSFKVFQTLGYPRWTRGPQSVYHW